jgi:serine protease SohB
MIHQYIADYYHIPIYVLSGYVLGKIFSRSKKSTIESRFTLTNYKNVFQNETGNKNKNKTDQDIKNKEQNKQEKTYLVYDFDQVNNQSKVDTYLGNDKEKTKKVMFEQLSFFVSYAIHHFDPQTTEILFRISSPGGYAYQFEKAKDDVSRLKTHGFMTTAFIDDICASGGYMLACACQKIICTDTASIGSVGAVASYTNFHDILEKLGITNKKIGTSEHKCISNMSGEKETDREQELIREDINYSLNMFLKIISDARPNVDIKHIQSAKVWYGNDALDNKMVDEIGSIDDHMLKLSQDENNKVLFVSSNNEHEESSLIGLLFKKIMS